MDVGCDTALLSALLEGRTVATAESCTGGLIAQALAQAEGSSEWFCGGIVAYQRRIKFDVLGVTPGPVVTERTAREMAQGVAGLLGTDIAVAVTGAAGPDPHDGAPPGTVVIATLIHQKVCARTHHFDGDPEEVCARARDTALYSLLAELRRR